MAHSHAENIDFVSLTHLSFLITQSLNISLYRLGCWIKSIELRCRWSSSVRFDYHDFFSEFVDASKLVILLHDCHQNLFSALPFSRLHRCNMNNCPGRGINPFRLQKPPLSLLWSLWLPADILFGIPFESFGEWVNLPQPSSLNRAHFTSSSE